MIMIRTACVIFVLYNGVSDVSGQYDQRMRNCNLGEIQLVRNGKCYWFSRPKKTWRKALAYCANSTGRKLAEIKSATENEAVITELRAGQYDSVWLGLSDRWRNEHWVFETSRDPAVFFDWARGEPDNYRRREFCVEMRQSYYYKWNDARCNKNNSVLCEREPLMIDEDDYGTSIYG